MGSSDDPAAIRARVESREAIVAERVRRAEEVLTPLRARQPEAAWAVTAGWRGRDGRPLPEAERRREALKTALHLRDSNRVREAALFAAEIDRHLEAAEAVAMAREDGAALARILDLRATLAAGFDMDTRRARELRRRAAEAAPELLPRRVVREPGTRSEDTTSQPEGGTQ